MVQNQILSGMADFRIMALGRGGAEVLLLWNYRFPVYALPRLVPKILIDATFGSIPFPCTMFRTLHYGIFCT